MLPTYHHKRKSIIIAHLATGWHSEMISSIPLQSFYLFCWLLHIALCIQESQWQHRIQGCYVYIMESTSRLRCKLLLCKWIVLILPKIGNIWQIQWDCSQYVYTSLSHSFTWLQEQTRGSIRALHLHFDYHATIVLWLHYALGQCADVTPKVHTDHRYTYQKYL